MAFFLETFAETLGAYVIGTAISAIVLGVMIDKFVIKRVMNNPKVKHLVETFERAEKRLDEILAEKNGHSE